jgi:hypothetical protein
MASVLPFTAKAIPRPARSAARVKKVKKLHR